MSLHPTFNPPKDQIAAKPVGDAYQGLKQELVTHGRQASSIEGSPESQEAMGHRQAQSHLTKYDRQSFHREDGTC